MSQIAPWAVSGTYFEACNCEAVCPCRREGNRAGGRSTYGVCDFALSWHVTDGDAGGVRLDGLDEAQGPVTCGIPGHDHPGREVRTELLRVSNGPLRWEVHGRCGFATDFAYASGGG